MQNDSGLAGPPVPNAGGGTARNRNNSIKESAKMVNIDLLALLPIVKNDFDLT